MPFNTFREDEKIEESLNIDIIKRLFSYLKPYIPEVVKTLVFMAGVVAAELLNPYFLKIGIDKYIKEGQWKELLIFGGIMIVVNAVSLVCSRLRTITMGKVSNSILFTIRQQLYSHIQKLSFSFFDSRPVGKILARIIGDVNSLNELFVNSVTTLIPEFVKIVSVVVIMMIMNYRLGLVALATVAVMVVVMFLIMTVSRRRWMVYRKKTSNLNAFSHESFSGIRVTQSFAAEGKMSSTFNDLLKQQRDAFVKAVRLNDLFWPIVEM